MAEPALAYIRLESAKSGSMGLRQFPHIPRSAVLQGGLLERLAIAVLNMFVRRKPIENSLLVQPNVESLIRLNEAKHGVL